MVRKLLSEARQIGYETIRLESTQYMIGARNLYRFFGFQDNEPCLESEIPGEFRAHRVLMQLHLKQ